MITVCINKHNGKYCGLKVFGHAGYEEHGKDIVCSAVSILIINAANSIESFTDDLIFSDTHEDGTTEMIFCEDISHDTILLMDSLLLGLNQIKDVYGKKYLKIEYKEV